MLEEIDTADVTAHYFPIQMNSKKALQLVLAWIAGLGSVVAILSMLTQAMLNGTTAEAVWWGRLYVWWIDFLLAGWLLMASIYLVRKSRRVIQAEVMTGSSRLAWRVVLFPLGHVLLTGCLYFADYAWYLRHYGAEVQSSNGSMALFSSFAVLLLLLAAVVFFSTYRLGRRGMH